MPPPSIWIGRYYIGAAAYGASRKIVQLWDANEVYTNTTTNKLAKKPMLMGNKMCAFALGVACSSVMAPLWVMGDLNRIDIYMKGESYDEYGFHERNHFCDYIIA